MKPEQHIDVIIIDSLPPEAVAMIQAMYSRDPQSVIKHLASIKREGVDSFMKKWYVGYGHQSIGDCGSTTLFIENVSMLTAKAFQHSPLYNGQESSTRYLNFDGRTISEPLGIEYGGRMLVDETTMIERYADGSYEVLSLRSEPISPESSRIGIEVQQRLMDFYRKMKPVLFDHIAKENPKSADQDQGTYERSVNARVFDILRSFIPAGMTTFLSWHTTLRHAHDHLAWLKYHPCDEIANTASAVRLALSEKYPSSFGHKQYEETENYLKRTMKNFAYFNGSASDEIKMSNESFNPSLIYEDFAELLKNRPFRGPAPHFLGSAGVLNLNFLLDFGSFRDLQRHRKGVIRMPLLTTKYGFNQWYLDQMPETMRIEAVSLLTETASIINQLELSDEHRQYYIPMGYNVVCDCSWTLDQCIYVAELRSTVTVHPTLRPIAQAIAKKVIEMLPFCKIYTDNTPDQWSYKRGTQTILEKK